MDYMDADWRPAGPGWGTKKQRKPLFAAQRRVWRKMTRAERRRTLRTLRDCAVALSCVIVAIGLPGWVEYIL